VDTSQQLLSICSGIGGLDLGFREGMRELGRDVRPVCYVEREAYTASVLAKKMEDGSLDSAPIWLGDLKELPTRELPRVDWIVGGYPCQPFSHAGKRLAEKDPRHVWPNIVDIIDTVRPRGVFFENVAGHIRRGLPRVLQDLGERGFRCSFGLFTAQEVGAPHKRERVFILGVANHDRQRRIQQREAHHNHRREPQRNHAHRRSEAVADGVSTRLERHLRHERDTERNTQEEAAGSAAARRLPERWPAGPGAAQFDWEPPRVVCGMGRGAHGVSDRVERLRALGNAVVPQQASHSFLTLWRSLHA